ncbi:formylglycine-generating enzyme family protein, partial [bacterium]|nr:formylglycine-generating enzyme family protein [bacterium]
MIHNTENSSQRRWIAPCRTWLRRCFPAVVLILIYADGAIANTLPIITNVTVSTLGDSLIVRYDIEDPEENTMRVSLYAAGIEMPPLPTPPLRGDIGSGVTSGIGKRIVFPLSALPERTRENFVPRLLAHDGVGYGAEMISVISKSGPDFMVDRFELTNEQFAAFVRSDGYERMEYWIIDDGSLDIEETGWNYAGRFRWIAPRHWDPRADPPWSSDPYSNTASSPVLGVSWFEAYAYCKWAGRRLPASSEFDEAAGLLEADYPWGDDPLVATAPDPAAASDSAATSDALDNGTAGSSQGFYGLANIRFGYANYKLEGFTHDGY